MMIFLIVIPSASNSWDFYKMKISSSTIRLSWNTALVEKDRINPWFSPFIYQIFEQWVSVIAVSKGSQWRFLFVCFSIRMNLWILKYLIHNSLSHYYFLMLRLYGWLAGAPLDWHLYLFNMISVALYFPYSLTHQGIPCSSYMFFILDLTSAIFFKEVLVSFGGKWYWEAVV